MQKNLPTKTLLDAFPDCFDGKGIFSEMDDLPWEDIVSADMLDMDYFGNHSGWKKCSPLIYKMFSDEFELSDADREKLANLITAKFLPNWTNLWNSYHFEYDPFDDYDVTESGQDAKSFNRSKASTHSGTRDDITTDALTHGESIAESANKSGTEDTTFTHGETITDADMAHIEEANSRYGFNSENAVPTDAREGDSTDNRTTVHSGNDVTDRDTSENESRITTHGGQDSRRIVLDGEDSSTDNSSATGSDAGNYTKHIRGLRGDFTRQQIILQERELWRESFFDKVYSDVDSVLASLIYKREHQISPYSVFPFGYYSI